MSVYNDQVAENIYKNGIDLVVLGIKDSQVVKEEPRRGLSAILNSYAGLLLLLKSKLADVSASTDYSLVSKIIRPRLVGGTTVWFGDKALKSTVDYNRMKENFEHLQCRCSDWKTFWTVMDRLRKFRNDIEHKYSNESEEAVIARLADIRWAADFVLREAIGVHPEIELDEVWQWLADQTDVVAALRERQGREFAGLQWLNQRLIEMVKAHTCPACGYPIILLKEGCDDDEALHRKFKCGSCTKTFEYAELIKAVLETQSFDDEWRWKDEWRWDHHFCTCPECGEYAFDTNTSTCYCCGFQHEYTCPMCLERLTSDEIECVNDSTLGGYCFHCRHMLEKDD